MEENMKDKSKDINISLKYPEMKDVLDFEKNKEEERNVDDYDRRTNKLINLICPHCGEHFVSGFSKIHGKPVCPFCKEVMYAKVNSIAYQRPVLASLWDYEHNDANEDPKLIPAHSNKPYHFKCSVCGKSVVRKPNKVGKHDTVLCENCQIINKSSFRETAIYYYCQQYFDNVVWHKKSAEGHEIDVYIEDYDVGINFDGKVHASTLKRDLEIQNSIRNVVNKLFVLSEVNENENEFVQFISHKADDNKLSKSILELFKKIDNTKNYDIDVKRDYQKINKIYYDFIASTGSVSKTIFEFAPELNEEWDYEKNELDPNTIAYNSCVEAFWKCKNSHSYKMSVYKKSVTKNKCPYCAHRKFLKGFNDLNSVLPNFVMNHWDFERNKYLISPDEVFKYSKRYTYFKGFENKKKIAAQVQNYTRRLKRRNLEIR